MVEHIVLFHFRERANGKTKAENLQEAKARMLALKEQIPEILFMEVKLGMEGSAPGNYDFCLRSRFENLETLDIYQKHPAHVAFGQFVFPLREEDGRACIDYEL